MYSSDIEQKKNDAYTCVCVKHEENTVLELCCVDHQVKQNTYTGNVRNNGLTQSHAFLKASCQRRYQRMFREPSYILMERKEFSLGQNVGFAVVVVPD